MTITVLEHVSSGLSAIAEPLVITGHKVCFFPKLLHFLLFGGCVILSTALLSTITQLRNLI